MKLFRDLTRKEEAEFRKWARENYTPHTEINGTWHPVIQDECAKMNAVANLPTAFSEALTKAGYIHGNTQT